MRASAWLATTLAVGLALTSATGNATDTATATEKLRRELISPWIVTVEGERRARGMHIRGAEQTSDGVWTLEVTYEWLYAEKQSPIKGELTAVPGGYRLELITRANSRIVGDSHDLKVFVGSFTPKSGVQRQATIEKVSAEEFARRQKAALLDLFVKPQPGVPAACAAFIGRWTGRWQRYYFPEESLWVTEVNPDCIAKFIYRDRTDAPMSFASAPIKDGELSFICAPGRNGTCVFKRVGDDLWVSYSDPTGGSNTAVFKPVAPDGK
jgi:hypothetical protein